MVTKEDILKQENEDELFCLIDEFLLRVTEKGWFNQENYHNNKRVILTDMRKIIIIREMIKANQLNHTQSNLGVDGKINKAVNQKRE